MQNLERECMRSVWQSRIFGFLDFGTFQFKLLAQLNFQYVSGRIEGSVDFGSSGVSFACAPGSRPQCRP